MRQVPLHGSHLLPRPSPAPVVPSRRLRSPSPGEGTGGSIPPGRETKAEARRPGGQASSGTAAAATGRMARCIRGWEKGNQGSETSECLGCILPSAGLPGQGSPEPSPAAPRDLASERPPHSAHLRRSAPAPSDGSGESPAARARARALALSRLRPSSPRGRPSDRVLARPGPLRQRPREPIVSRGPPSADHVASQANHQIALGKRLASMSPGGRLLPSRAGARPAQRAESLISADEWRPVGQFLLLMISQILA